MRENNFFSSGHKRIMTFILSVTVFSAHFNVLLPTLFQIFVHTTLYQKIMQHYLIIFIEIHTIFLVIAVTDIKRWRVDYGTR